MRPTIENGAAHSAGRWLGLAAVAALGVSIAGCGSSGNDNGGDKGDERPLAEVARRSAAGRAIHLGETVTTEGVVTVGAGIFANNKLKIFFQDGTAGAMVFHRTAADVDAFQRGDRLRVSGVVLQEDPVPNKNAARGTVLVDITDGDWTVLAVNRPQPPPGTTTLAAVDVTAVGTVVRVTGLRKVEGEWPTAGSRSTEVRITDDAGATVMTLRLQRNTITEELAAKLETIGDDGFFDVDAIVVQDDLDENGSLLGGFELWIRGTGDLRAAG